LRRVIYTPRGIHSNQRLNQNSRLAAARKGSAENAKLDFIGVD
jgi:hypothetical protein